MNAVWIVSKAKSRVNGVAHADEYQSADHDEEDDEGLRDKVFFVTLGEVREGDGRVVDEVGCEIHLGEGV